MTLALNNDLVDGEKPIYRRTVARIMCVNRIYSNKTKYKKQNVTPSQNQTRQLRMFSTVTLILNTQMKNGV